MTKIYVLVEEHMEGASVVFASLEKEKCEQKIREDYARDLRHLAVGLWRSGSSIISIQETELG